MGDLDLKSIVGKYGVCQTEAHYARIHRKIDSCKNWKPMISDMVQGHIDEAMESAASVLTEGQADELDVTNKQAAISEEREIPTSALRPSNGQEDECWICGAPDHGGECKPLKVYPANATHPQDERDDEKEMWAAYKNVQFIGVPTSEPADRTYDEWLFKLGWQAALASRISK